jgi:beta-lactam-binding protein with PASTA domain
VQTTAADPLIGRTLEARYRILEGIARGGMSTVYAAVDERLDRLVAVKVMSAALSADPAFSDRFAREARAAARLSHSNAVSVYDQGTDSGPAGHHVFLVMELVQGRTLRELIRERGRLSPAEAISIMEPVLGALSAAHRAGLVHRDVKPENILLSDEGVVKVADFGLARAVESDAAATRTGLMMGTVAYCAPEQISRGRADQRSDVYSAGVVLFELLTGAPPYKGESAMNVAYQHVHSRVPAPSSRVKGIPSEIDELVVSATDSDPTGRPADAGAFLAEVADARAALGLPIMGVPPRARPRGRHEGGPARNAAPGAHTTDVLGGRVGRHDTMVAGMNGPGRPAALSNGASGDGPTGGPRRLVDGPPPPIVTPPPKQRKQVSVRTRRRRRALIAVLVVLLLGLAAGYGSWYFTAGRYSRVPDVKGLAQNVAKADLLKAHYKLGTVTSVFSETAETGTVMSTNPGPGRALKNHRVSLVISKGKERFTIPSVLGRTEAQARAALATIPVQVATPSIPETSDTVKAGLVISTNPAPGASVPRNQVVTITVSSGLPTVSIPTIQANTAFEDAKAALTARGFKVVEQDVFSNTDPPVPAGIVISSSPTVSALKFSTITVVVSKGPQMVTVPDIAPLSQLAAAEAALTKVGLSYQVVTGFPGGSGDEVLGLNPKSGRSVPIATTVVISVF